MHIAPFAHLFRTFYIIVGYIHTTRIGYTPIDNHNLTVVTSVDVIDPGESDRGVLHNLNTFLAQRLQVIFFQRLVVGVVAKAVEHSTYLDTFPAFLLQQVEQQHCNGIVTEVEVLKMDAALGLTDSLKHIVELLLT